jgi:hypothetical protein
MIVDMTHLGVLDALARELQDNLLHYNSRCSGIEDKRELLALRLQQNDDLTEILRKQRRHLRFMNGEKIEPETHVVEAVLTGFGGLVS